MKKKIFCIIAITILLVSTSFLLGFFISKNNNQSYNNYPTEYVECYSVSFVHGNSNTITYYTSKEYSPYEPYKEIWIKFDKDKYYLKLIDWDNSISESSGDRHVQNILVNYK